MLQNLSTNSTNWDSYLKFAIITMLSIALASPVISHENNKQRTIGSDIAIILDASDSMQEDNRFKISKEIISNFIKKRTNDRISLSLFADQVYIASPLTHDKKSLLSILQYIKLGIAGNRKTSLYEAIYLSSKLFEPSDNTQKIAIVLTDGLNTTDTIPLQKALIRAKNNNIKIYTIGIGDDYSADILKEISKQTDGKFFQTKNAKNLDNIYSQIDSLEKEHIVTDSKTNYDYLYIYPLSLALILLFILLLNEFFISHLSMATIISILLITITIYITPKSETDNQQKINTPANTLHILLDISRSMNNQDIFPSRIKAMTSKLQKLIKQTHTKKISLIAFSKIPYLIMPPTTNKNAISTALDRLDVTVIDQAGTNILSALQAIGSIESNSSNKVALLVTDGGTKDDYNAEATYANEHNMTILIYAIATKAGGIIKDGSKILVSKQGDIITTPLNQNIAILAHNHNISDTTYTLSDDDINRLSKQINSLTKSDSSDINVINMKLLYTMIILTIIILFLQMYPIWRSR